MTAGPQLPSLMFAVGVTAKNFRAKVLQLLMPPRALNEQLVLLHLCVLSVALHGGVA